MASDHSAPPVTAIDPEMSASRPPRPRKPDYHHIHRQPLPIKIHPLPPLIPHNPLSILHIAVAYLSQLIYPPERSAPYKAYFCNATSSIQVTDPETMRALWEMGFFGKGSLSRSEPTWLERERRRRGVGGRGTNEEATGKRRAERRDFKLERARKGQEAIAEKLKAEAKLRNDEETGSIETVLKGSTEDKVELSNGHMNGNLNGHANGHISDIATSPVTNSLSRTRSSCLSRSEQSENCDSDLEPCRKRGASLKTVRFSPTIEAREFDLSAPTLAPIKNPGPEVPAPELSPPPRIVNQEYLHLSSEEAFFLVYGLGVLEIHLSSDDDSTQTMLPPNSLLPLLRRTSYFPPRSISGPLEPDDPFLISYVVYHHFRSQGWIVRSGVKFSVDYLLYNRGPVFAHAEFAVVILPSYSHPYWSESEERQQAVEQKQGRPWWWLHCINRVQAQVRKSLVLVYVDVPPPPEGKAKIDIGALLRGYKIQEVNVKRWTPNRSRD